MMIKTTLSTALLEFGRKNEEKAAGRCARKLANLREFAGLCENLFKKAIAKSIPF
jgi:hypothetical protein